MSDEHKTPCPNVPASMSQFHPRVTNIDAFKNHVSNFKKESGALINESLKKNTLRQKQYLASKKQKYWFDFIDFNSLLTNIIVNAIVYFFFMNLI